MQSNCNLKKHSTASYYIKLSIGLAAGIIFWMLPPIAPLTQSGVRVFVLFCIILYFSAINEMIWPGVLSVVCMAFLVSDIYPDLTTTELYRAIELSWGFWMIPFIIACLILAFALKECGFMKRIATWIISRNLAQKNPWTFTIALVFSSLFLGLFFDPLAALVFVVGFSGELFEKLGYKRGDSYPCAVTISMGFAVMIAYGMTPISHPLPIMAIGIYQSMTGNTMSFPQYMAAGIPVGLICFVGLIVMLRFIMKPDMTLLQKADFKELIDQEIPKMEKRERLTAIICLSVILTWLVFGLIQIIAPQSTANAFFDKLTIVSPAFIGISLLALIRIDGRPLMDIEHGLKNGVTWNVILLLAALLMTGNALSQDTTGFPALLNLALQPMLNAGISPFLMMFFVVAIAIVCTNFLNNIPVVMLLLAACIPISAQLGISPMTITFLITFSGQMAFATPSSFAAITFLYGVDWAKPKLILKYGLTLMLVCIAIVSTFGYLWASILL